MKKLLVTCTIIVVLLASFLGAKAYWTVSGIQPSEILIKKGTSAAIQIGCSKNTLTTTFGTPLQQLNYNFEIENKTGHLGTDNGANIYFIHHKLIGC